LDVNCGAGVLAVKAAQLELAKVIALDRNPDAVKDTKENARTFGVERKIKVLRRDLNKDYSAAWGYLISYWRSSDTSLDACLSKVFTQNLAKGGKVLLFAKWNSNVLEKIHNAGLSFTIVSALGSEAVFELQKKASSALGALIATRSETRSSSPVEEMVKRARITGSTKQKELVARALDRSMALKERYYDVVFLVWMSIRIGDAGDCARDEGESYP